MGRLAVVVGKTHVSRQAVAQFHTDIGQHAHRLGLIVYQIIAVPNRDLKALRDGEIHGDWQLVVKRVIFGMTIAHAQVHIHDFSDVGAHTAIEPEFHVLRAQRRINLRRDKGIVVDDVAETQQLSPTVQPRIKLQFLVQDEKATAQIGADSQETVFICVLSGAVQTHPEVQPIKFVAHLEERIGLEPNTVNDKKIADLTHAIVVLESQIETHLLRMALVTPEVVSIAKFVAKINIMFPIKHIEIVQMGVMA